MRYTKHYSSPTELLKILQERGLDCSDIDDAESALRRNSSETCQSKHEKRDYECPHFAKRL